MAVRYLAANHHPDHDTIATFRKRFLAELKPLFVQTLLIALQMALLKLGTVSLDGTKIKANASKHRALSWHQVCKLEQQLKAEVEALLHQAEAANQSDLPDGLDIPEELARREVALCTLPEALGKVDILLADTGYYSATNVGRCLEHEIQPYISSQRDPHHQSLKERFAEPEPLPDHADVMTEMKHRLKTQNGRALYGKRKSTVEPVFGIIKAVMGFRQFLLRGVESVCGECENRRSLSTIVGQARQTPRCPTSGFS